MRKVEQVTRPISTVVEITCDRCKKVVSTDDIDEAQEFMTTSYDAGYGNRVFQDGDHLQVDLCQYCVKEVLGPYMRLVCNPITHFGYDND